MGKFWKNTAKAIRDDSIKKAFWLVIGLLGTLGLALYRLVSKTLDLTSLILICVIIGLLAFIVTYLIWVRLSYRHPWYPRVRWKYEVLKKVITYKICEDGRLHFSRRVKIRALTDQVEEFRDRYSWTGASGDKSMPQPGENVESIHPKMEAGIWCIYDTVFAVALSKGEEYEFQVDWFLDDWQTARPFFSTSTEEPTKELEMKLIIAPKYLRDGRVIAEYMRGIESHYAFSSEELTLQDGVVVWTPKPKLYTHYRIRWAWKGEAALEPLPE